MHAGWAKKIPEIYKSFRVFKKPKGK
jgi:hypothetical protein